MHFHGPGVPFLESLGRMASGVKPTPWPTPCSQGPKTMEKKRPKTVVLGPILVGGGLKPKIKFNLLKIDRVGLWCTRKKPTKGIKQGVLGFWRANIGSTVHFHGPGVPFLESRGRMASGVKPTPWPAPCSRTPKTLKKKLFQTALKQLPHLGWAGGALKTKFAICAKLAES